MEDFEEYDNVEYDFREINFKHFYSFPMTTRIRDGNASFSTATVKLIKKV